MFSPLSIGTNDVLRNVDHGWIVLHQACRYRRRRSTVRTHRVLGIPRGGPLEASRVRIHKNGCKSTRNDEESKRHCNQPVAIAPCLPSRCPLHIPHLCSPYTRGRTSYTSTEASLALRLLLSAGRFERCSAIHQF